MRLFMKIIRNSLIVKIALFQLITLAIAVSVYWYFYHQYQKESEDKFLNLRKSEVVASIMPYYDELVSSYILDINDHYQELRDELIKNKGLVGLSIVEKGTLLGIPDGVFKYTIAPRNSKAMYTIILDDSDITANLLRMKMNERRKNMIIWGMIFALLLGSSIYIYDKEISKPIRRLLNAIRKEVPREDLIRVVRNDGGEIGKIAYEVSEMIQRIKGVERIESDLEREKEVNLMHSKMAHDMRSPISVLKSFVEVETRKSHIDVEFSEAAQRSVKKLNRMADGLLDYAKAKKIVREVVYIDQIFDKGVKAEVIDVASDRGAEITVSISGGLCSNVDGHKIARVLTNMIQNALKAVNEGEGSVEVAAYEDGGKDLYIILKDNGCGIDAKDLPHIFENFFSTDRKKGTGLGLSYCKQVVEAHGGTIDVASEVGKGTTFTIRIPDCVVPEGQARAYLNDPQLKIDGRRFVLVDDDADIRMRWRNIVEQGGGKVVAEADSPEKATGDGLDLSCADVAIVDYSFEDSAMTGVDVIAHLKKMGIKEIHMCTGYADDEAVRRAALEAGADSVIKKTLA